MSRGNPCSPFALLTLWVCATSLSRSFNELLQPPWGLHARKVYLTLLEWLLAILEQRLVCKHKLSPVIDVINIYTLQSTAVIRRQASVSTVSEALVLNGYVGASPLSPTIAMSLSTLELYRRIQLCKPSFSVEAFAKVICDLYKWPYHRCYRNVLADCFDVYLMMRCKIGQQVSEALGHNTANWRVLNSCPPCSYELEDEPELKFCKMIVFDGNNSLSCMAPLGGREVGNQHIFNSDYFLDPEFVDKFADEVKSGPQPSDANVTTTQHLHGEHASTATAPTSVCTDNWKAARVDMKKKSWGIFEETGVFACACRHSITQWIVDMIRSGELFKYPLSIVSMALDVLGPRLLIGYDVGCKLATTISSSSLATLFAENECRMCVDAFHGYTHNYACQDINHPNVIEGIGLEDLATMERIFSHSNQLAPVIRYASAYNRRMFIDMLFRQWDKDKYLNLSNMLYGNYKQALRIINEDGFALQEAKHSLGISDGDIKVWRAEQSEYLRACGQEPEYDIHAIAYVEMLQKLRDARAASENASSLFLGATPSDYQYSTVNTSYTNDLSHTRKIETQRRHATEQYDQILHEVTALEVEMGIMRRWEPIDPQYIDTIKFIATRSFHKSLANLQCLVVQRLFELHKLNISKTSYHMRTHIAKSLQTRCKAIQNAVKIYNEAVLTLNPSAPMLDWSKVSHYGFLEEFTLLQDTRQDIWSKRWTEPAVCEVIKQSLWIERAHEEVTRCNVEIRHLHTAIVDEQILFAAVLKQLEKARDPLYGAVDKYCERQQRINAHILYRINDIFALNGFSGSKTTGIHKGQQVDKGTGSISTSVDALISISEDHTDESDDGFDDSDATAGDIGGLVDYISELAIA
ncbi:hypothetical protein DFH29DRAFT_979487 [Suillus ampliporus]|nr:hypothetical protein DFH29DRAFT_979487 [Suillus ampliporus]